MNIINTIDFSRKEMIAKQSWLTCADLLDFAKGEFRLKARDKLEKEGCICHWYTYVQMFERFTLYKMNFVFTDKKLDFEREREMY